MILTAQEEQASIDSMMIHHDLQVVPGHQTIQGILLQTVEVTNHHLAHPTEAQAEAATAALQGQVEETMILLQEAPEAQTADILRQGVQAAAAEAHILHQEAPDLHLQEVAAQAQEVADAAEDNFQSLLRNL